MSDPTPAWNLYSGDSESYFLPYSNSNFGQQTAGDPNITVQVDGQTFTAPLDTGSRGASIPQASVPNITQGPNDPPGFLFYWSSGIKNEGYWHTMTLTLPDAVGTNTGGAPATVTVPVLIVQQVVAEAGDWPNGSRPTTEVTIPQAGTRFLNFGIGFDRTGDGTSPENSNYNQQYNPFLNLSQMSDGSMLSGYILTQNGVQLGLTAANTAPTADNGLSPFAYDKLIPTPFAQVPGSPPDWQAGTGSVTLDGTPYATGQTVLDIGIGNALLSLPSPPSPADPSSATTLAARSSITVNFLNSDYNVGYSFSVGNTADVMTPQNVTWSAIQTGNQAFSENVDQTTLFNSGRNAINGFNYLYDATDGYIGLQLNTPTAQTGAFLSPDVALQGTVALPAGFTTDYPVLLQNPTTITVPGSARFGAQVSGTGMLNVVSGSVDLLTANTNTGGVVIGANATLEVGNSMAGGTGPINFNGVGATLLIDPGVVPTEIIGSLQQGDFIDLAGINGGTVAVSDNQLTIANGSTSVTLSLDTTYFGGQFRASPDGSGGTMVSYVASTVPYVVPIYHGTGTSLIIYASLNGGPLDPYLLDSGSPNMFSVYGSWWPGYTSPVSQPGTDSFSFANGTTYFYNAVPTSVALGTGPGGTVVAAASNVNVAQITNIGTASPATDFANWASSVAAGNAPITEDDTYGNFSAGLYGSNSLATVLAQIPIGSNLKNGFIIQSGGASATSGSLTVGLDPSVISQWETNPATIVLEMQQSGTTLPNPDGNAQTVNGYDKAQINSNLTLTLNGTSAPYAIPTVIDTGGGPNNIIYNPGGTPDLSSWLQPGTNVLQNGVTFDLAGTTPANGIASFLDYVTGPDALSGGGNSLAISSTSIPGTLRVNPGISLFYDYNIMFDLQDGLVLLQPITCFVAGTRIATARGLIAVEQLRENDLLPTCIGRTLEPIRWIGRRKVDCRSHPNPATVWPVRVAAGAFADGVPARDLYLSPDHAVYADGVLIPVKHLINGTTIVQVRRASVDYYHIELSRHDVVLAEGLAVESYLDVHDRSVFDNGGPVRQLHPDFAAHRWEAEGCAALVVTGPIVQALRERIALRAATVFASAAVRQDRSWTVALGSPPATRVS